MRLGTAIECLVDNYKYASDKEWINDKVAWALYHTWKIADRKTENSSEKPNNCEECKHWNDTKDGCADRHGCRATTEDSSMVEPLTERPCNKCEWYQKYGKCVFGYCHYEPQTERSER